MLNLLVSMNTPNSPWKLEVGGVKGLKNLLGFLYLLFAMGHRADRETPLLLY